MLTFHPVEICGDLCRDNPLYIGNFFKLRGMWWRKRKQRQGLILSIAVAWFRTFRKNPLAPGFINEEVLITSLTSQVKDAKLILEHFFEITRIGYNFNDGNKSPTQIVPKKLNPRMMQAIDDIINEVKFAPGSPPVNKKYICSTVKIEHFNTKSIKERLLTDGREDLIPPVNWLLTQTTINFYFEPAGRLQARDKSVWPIKSIELWPGWLRTALFGRVADIENAYCQFLISKLETKFENNKLRFQLKYPDLIRMDTDKKKFREELCRDLLKLELCDENINVVKRLLMALANGSNATPGLMLDGSSRSEAVRIIKQANPELSPSELITIGARLSFIAKQFKSAKKDICISALNCKPTRDNQKKIFRLYMDWERKSRYAIWENTGRTGLMLHDGIDGIISDLTDTEIVNLIEDRANLRISVD